MIDRDAKILGKVNIIDALIILVLVGALAFGIYQFRGGGGIIGGEMRTFYITFFTEATENFIVEGMSIGDNLFDHARGLLLGAVTEIDIADAIVWNADQHGNAVRSSKEGFSSLRVTARINGTPSDHGVLVAGNRYGIGMNVPIRAGQSAVLTRISGLREADR
ncbi:MAG: DUF4330 domain-containing protein [Defluviitaleaceae bacterium]|nr:DUF4330 domain-containing protein [Defluviitaleaceae bacterium]MCL2273511.1 DUF4330 domain-containing protein [Defluviitaleaceae bacterium]